MGLTPLDGARRAAELAASVARTRLGLPDRPRLLTYVVTFRCNARCVMCDSWRKDGEGELDLAQIEAIYKQLPRLHAVRLTGGEPFVRKDFAEIAALTERVLRPALLHVTTNGFLTDRIVAFCEQRARKVPLQLLVSIDGVGEKHNEVRGRNNAWDQAMATVRALAPRQRELGIELAVNQTIVDAEGARHYTKLRDVLAPLGVRNQVVIAYDASATYSLKREVEVGPQVQGSFTTFGDLGADVLGDLFAEIDRDLERYPLHLRVAKRYYLEGIRSRLLHGRGSPNPPCVALGAHLRMYPNGDVPTCQFNSHRVGNLATERFADLWSGPSVERQRRWVRDCAGCWAECEVLPNALYSGDLLRAVRSARRNPDATQPSPAEPPSGRSVSIS
jgi:MoaA/NifB/PqqE/SkfB family radical SAM enzyme